MFYTLWDERTEERMYDHLYVVAEQVGGSFSEINFQRFNRDGNEEIVQLKIENRSRIEN